MRSTKSASSVGVEVLVEPDIITEERIGIEFRVPSISSTLAFYIATEDVDNTVLNFFGDIGQVHEITTARRTLNLKVVTIVLVESL